MRLCLTNAALLLSKCRCSLLLPSEYRGVSVGRSVTLVSPAKWLNRSRCCLGCGPWMGPRSHVLDDGVEIHTHEGTIVTDQYSTQSNSAAAYAWQWTYSKLPSKWQNRYGVDASRRECTLAPPGEYDWTTRVWRRRSLMSNYSDHLFLWESKLSPE